MTPFYRLTIRSVDGVTSYSVDTTDKHIALGFLQRFDHEGSDVCMTIDDADEPNVTKANAGELKGEEVYKRLWRNYEATP